MNKEELLQLFRIAISAAQVEERDIFDISYNNGLEASIEILKRLTK